MMSLTKDLEQQKPNYFIFLKSILQLQCTLLLRLQNEPCKRSELENQLVSLMTLLWQFHVSVSFMQSLLQRNDLHNQRQMMNEKQQLEKYITKIMLLIDGYAFLQSKNQSTYMTLLTEFRHAYKIAQPVVFINGKGAVPWFSTTYFTTKHKEKTE